MVLYTCLSENVLDELNPIMERTMGCRVGENGEILPIFPHMKEEPNLILKTE